MAEKRKTLHSGGHPESLRTRSAFIRGFVLFLLLCPAIAGAADLQLTWDPSAGPDVAGYKIYHGASSRNYSASTVIGKQTTYTFRGLMPGTWYFAVTAYDAQGNESGFSNEVSSAITPDQALTITAVDTADLTSSSIVITWETSRISDSQVEYGTTTAYSSLTELDSSMVTEHSQTLSDLAPSTLYHYRVKSRDAAGHSAVSDDFIFRTPKKMPKFELPAEIQPTDWSVPSSPDGVGREETAPTPSIIFPEIGDAVHTRILAANTEAANRAFSFELIGADGTMRGCLTLSVSGNGTEITNLSDALFSGAAPSAADYVRVRTTEGMQILELLQDGPLGITLQGQDVNEGATTLYVPQYIAGDGKKCALSIVNLDPSPGIILLKLVPDGSPHLEIIRIVPIPPNGKIYIDDPGFFQMLNLGEEIRGYVEVASDGIRLTGTMVFSDSNGEFSLSSLALASRLQNSVFLSNASSSGLFFTGILILNPGENDACLSIALHSPDGSLIAVAADVLPAKRRMFRSLNQYFPASTEQSWTTGTTRIVSDRPIAAFAQFEGRGFSILSKIPPQGVQGAP